MNYPKEFTNIYNTRSGSNWLNLVFFNSKSMDSLLFDGIEFSFIPNSIFDESLYYEITYSKEKNNDLLVIDEIRSDYSMSYIKFIDGDIFQIYFMMDDENAAQLLSIFKSIDTGYDLALKRCNQLDLIEVLEYDKSKSVEHWFPRNE